MIQTVASPFALQFSRTGGSLITARLDVWQPTPTGWQSVGQFAFSDPTHSVENVPGQLAPGSYTCVFQCYVEESLNGKYSFDFSVAGSSVYQDSGDVNTTSANNDSKVYKDQFVLKVT